MLANGTRVQWTLPSPEPSNDPLVDMTLVFTGEVVGEQEAFTPGAGPNETIYEVTPDDHPTRVLLFAEHALTEI